MSVHTGVFILTIAALYSTFWLYYNLFNYSFSYWIFKMFINCAMIDIPALKIQFSSIQSLSHVWLFAAPWTAASQASMSTTNSQSPPELKSIESVMPSICLILCCPLLFLPSIFLSIRVFSNEPVLHIRWPKDWNFSFNISPSNEHSGLISFRMDWLEGRSRWAKERTF